MAIDAIRGLLISDCLLKVEPLRQSLAGITDLQMTCQQTPAGLCGRDFDVVLLGQSGSEAEQFDAIEGLHHRLGSIPVLIVSDRSDQAFIGEVVRRGAQDVISSDMLNPNTLWRVILTSIERSRQERHRLRHAREDELTGLANRLLLGERFERAVARADRHATLVALVSIDLDQPEQLAECHGCNTLAQLMPMIGKRLMGEIRETDTLARTREAGFTWLVEGLAAIDDIEALVSRLPDLLATPFHLGSGDIQLTASVGVAVSPFHGRDFKTLLDMAEAAMLDVATLNGDGLLMPPLPTMAEESRSAMLV